jgi:hypothetical protein
MWAGLRSRRLPGSFNVTDTTDSASEMKCDIFPENKVYMDIILCFYLLPFWSFGEQKFHCTLWELPPEQALWSITFLVFHFSPGRVIFEFFTRVVIRKGTVMQFMPGRQSGHLLIAVCIAGGTNQKVKLVGHKVRSPQSQCWIHNRA